MFNCGVARLVCINKISSRTILDKKVGTIKYSYILPWNGGRKGNDMPVNEFTLNSVILLLQL
jgi:hypothetical protein